MAQTDSSIVESGAARSSPGRVRREVHELLLLLFWGGLREELLLLLPMVPVRGGLVVVREEVEAAVARGSSKVFRSAGRERVSVGLVGWVGIVVGEGTNRHRDRSGLRRRRRRGRRPRRFGSRGGMGTCLISASGVQSVCNG